MKFRIALLKCKFLKTIQWRYFCYFIFGVGSFCCAFAGPPLIRLPDVPLYFGSAYAHPNLLIDLSIDLSSVRAAYRNADDYSRAVTYLGYFNSKKCYQNGGVKQFALVRENGEITSDVQGGLTKFGSWSDLQSGYFYAIKDADSNFECGGDAFSGNFMNWASTSNLDILRLAFTGGDRVVDSASQTVLQRAFLPADFYNSSLFVKKVLSTTPGKSAPEHVTPYKVRQLYIFNCENRVMFSDSDTASNCTAQRTFPTNNSKIDTKLIVSSDRTLGEFLVRVQVCDEAESVARMDLCAQYPNGSYKPVGNIQRNPNSVRYGVFGYLFDPVKTRYGGVLRAPLKYVGSTQFRATNSFFPEQNDRQEWDLNTGVFLVNPEKDLNGNSGVINYINKFGRRGRYKSNDPLSELFYESIRYLQGVPATPASTDGMTADMRDNLPVITKWIDPIEASCQRNYVVVIGDTNTHQDTYLPGTLLAGANRPRRPAEIMQKDATGNLKVPPFDVGLQTGLVASMESGRAFGNSFPVPELANIASASIGVDAGTFYIAGTAYWAHTNNIRLDKPVKVSTFAIDLDDNGNGEINNVSRAQIAPRRSQLYLASKYGGFNDVNGDKNPFKTWVKDGVTVFNNDEWASESQLDPNHFFLAGEPRQLIGAANAIFREIVTSGGSLSKIGISSTAASGSPFIYVTGFSANKWSGKLLKKKLEPSASESLWDAGEILTGNPNKNIAAIPSEEDRNIYTSLVTSGSLLKTVPFLWNGGVNFSPTDQLILNTNPHSGQLDYLGQERINFLRGDRSLEVEGDSLPQSTTLFRSRSSVLGDIVNSAPVYYGPPAKHLSAPGYSNFYRRYQKRKSAVYVGANDGFLHAFDADSGKELFAYAPNALLSKLSALTDPAYSHTAFVDGQIEVKDVQIREEWRTILISGMGSGAKGIFALDVTEPDNFSGGWGALWEFTDKTDSDMGYLLSVPLIAKFRVGGTQSSPIYANYAVISSGYNNYGDFSGSSGQGAIFLLSLDKLPSEPWVLNANYFKLLTPIKDTTKPNGLTSPNIAYGVDGAVEHLYVGDLQGNVWRFSSLGTSISHFNHVPIRVFKAKSRTGQAQPITVQPQIVHAPGGGYILLFGTGKYLEESDQYPSDYGENSYYAIFDTTFNADVVTGREQLTPRVATPSGNGFNISGKDFTYGVKPPKSKGWYLDFPKSPTTGERIHHDLPGVVAGNSYVFNTMMLNGESCDVGGGRKYVVDLLSGLSDTETGYLSSIGLMSRPIAINMATTVSPRSSTGARRVTTTYSQYNQGIVGSEMTPLSDVVTRAGRLSWVEIGNFKELRKATLVEKNQR